jgi:hypothetical protein
MCTGEHSGETYRTVVGIGVARHTAATNTDGDNRTALYLLQTALLKEAALPGDRNTKHESSGSPYTNLR